MRAIHAFLFGATLALAVGPITILIVHVAAPGGLGAGVRSALGAAVADFLYASIACTAGHAVAPRLTHHREALIVLAGVALIVLGGSMLRASVRAGSDAGRPSPPAALKTPFFTTFSLTLVNPLGILVFGSFAMTVPPMASLTTAWAYASCVFLSALLVNLAYAGGGGALRRVLKHAVVLRRLNAASGIAIVCFFGAWPVLQLTLDAWQR